MRKRKEVISYFVLGLTLFFLLNLPTPIVSTLRSFFVFSSKLYAARGVSDEQLELMRLKVENEELKSQISLVRNWLKDEERIDLYLKRLESFRDDKGFASFYSRRVVDLTKLLSMQVHSIESKVIFRDPAFWSSGIWIDKGEAENKKIGRKIFAKNSPVIVGNALVGIVEEVEENRSYVRLITDSSLTPAVRAIRGDETNFQLFDLVAQLLEELELRPDIEGRAGVEAALVSLKNKLLDEGETRYLAKGELRGTSYPLWRQRSNTLKGIGFNYEFADREGEAKPIHEKHREAFLKKGDLLITSGLDGVFPAGLTVAVVSKIFPLKEGAYAYDLEAKASCPFLSELTTVRVLPPLLGA